MAQVLEWASGLCTALIALGALGQVAPKDKMVQFVQSLMVLALLASGAASLLHARWDFDLPETPAQAEAGGLEAFLNSQYVSATEEEAVRSSEGLLAAAGQRAKKIDVLIYSLEDSGIVLAKVGAAFAYPAEGERARALLQNVLGEDVVVEVTTDGA